MAKIPLFTTKLLLALILFITCSGLLAQFAGGSGTEADPYLIQTAQHLDNIRNYRSACFLQISDIDLNIPPFNQGMGWTYLAPEWDPFTGKYDGNRFIISNLYENGRATGIFGCVENATIRRVNIQNASFFNGTGTMGGGLLARAENSLIEYCNVSLVMEGPWNTGGLVGTIVGNTTVRFCSVSGTVHGSEYTGGLIGVANGGIITNCRTTAQVFTTSNYSAFGGLVGKAFGTLITNCSSSGSVNANGSVGGLVGSGGSNVVISNCFSTARVQGNFYCGGLVGTLSGTVTNCYSTGFVNQNSSGLIGNLVSGSVTNSYWDTMTSGCSASSGGSGRTTDQMTFPYSSDTFSDWDFTSVWCADSTFTYNSGYPYILVNETFGASSTVTFSHDGGLYSSPVQLLMQASTPQSVIHYTLDGSHPNSDSPVYEVPLTISTSTTVRAVAVRQGWLNSIVTTAVFDFNAFAGGDGTEDNPYLVDNAHQLNNVRSFLNAWFLQTANIDLNVYPYNQNTGWIPIGTISAPFRGHYNGDGWKIDNLYINTLSGDVGLFGYSSGNAELKNVVLTNADINVVNNDPSETGILVAYAVNSTITKCSSSGNVHGAFNTGGLIGYSSSTTVSDCYSTASVFGSDYVGGLIGTLYFATVERCYSTGHVSWSGAPHGGLIGSNLYGFSTVAGSYWDVQTSGISTSGGGEGRTTAEMTYPHAANTYMGWNFSYVWQTDALQQNSGYPFHKFVHQVAFPIISYTPVINGEPVIVTITCSTLNAIIRYTLDGSIPTETSNLYLEPVWVSPDDDSLVVVRAVGFKDGYLPSPYASADINFSTIIPEANQDLVGADKFKLRACPNPFSDLAEITFSLAKADRANLRIYNQRGQLVKVLTDGTYGKGENKAVWDGTDSNGRPVSSGVYFLRLQGEGICQTGKLLLIR